MRYTSTENRFAFGLFAFIKKNACDVMSAYLCTSVMTSHCFLRESASDGQRRLDLSTVSK